MKLTSDTVMQSFFIPSLGSQIYAMAGMVTRLNLKAQATGSFMGENTQYNGEGFQQQHFTRHRDVARRLQGVGPAGAHDRHPDDGGLSTASSASAASSPEMRQALHADGMPNGAVYFRRCRIPPF